MSPAFQLMLVLSGGLTRLIVGQAPPQGGGSGRGPPQGGGQGPPQGGGTGPGGGAGCVNPTCSSPPCAAKLLGDVGCTTVAGCEDVKHETVAAGGTINSNAHIYGPFEAGFTSRQDAIIKNWGCAEPSKVYDSDGGKDVDIAERHVAHACGITFPRTVGSEYFGLVGPCGGHTPDYHFHRRLSCLYDELGSHSTAVGVAASHKIYGKWEDFGNNRLPYLDACGGHIGTTPDSTTPVYHYHVQDKAPFTIGCYGPTSDGSLVSIATCRSLYSECGDGDIVSIATSSGTVSYDLFCPCFDADGSNTGTRELPALSTTEISYVSPSPAPTPSPRTCKPSPASMADHAAWISIGPTLILLLLAKSSGTLLS